MKYCTNCGNKLNEENNFCTKCGKPTKKQMAKIRNELKIKREKENETLLLWSGTILVILASIIFAFTTWENLSNLFKVLFLIFESIIFFASSYVFKTLKNNNASKVMCFLGTIFIPIILNFIATYELFGNYLSYNGAGIFVYLALSSFICTIIYYISYKFLKSKLFLFLSYTFIYLTIIFILYILKIDEINNSLIITILCSLNLITIIINSFVKEKTLNIFLSVLSIIFFGITLYNDATIFMNLIPYILEIVSLFLLIKNLKKNPFIYIFPVIILLLGYDFIYSLNLLTIDNFNITIFISTLLLVLLYLLLKYIGNSTISIISFITIYVLIYSYTLLTSLSSSMISLIMGLLIIFNVFIIIFDENKTENFISKLILPIILIIFVYNMFSIFIIVRPEFAIMVSSILCFLISNLIKNKKDSLNLIFEIFSYIFLGISSFIIIFTKSILPAFFLNELLWIFYFIDSIIFKKTTEECIVLFILSIINLLFCSISLNIKLYYVLLFITGIITILYIINDKIGLKNRNIYIYSLLVLNIILSLFNIKAYSIYSVMANVILYSLIFYLFNKREKLIFIIKYIYTLLGFILIYNLFNAYISEVVIANIFTLISYVIIIISMYLLEVDTDRRIMAYIPIIAIPYLKLVYIVDIFMNIKEELILSLFIILTFVIFEKVIEFSKKIDKEICEIVILSILFVYSLEFAVTFSFAISCIYLLIGIFKKINSFTILGIVTIILSGIINLFKIFNNLALIFIILLLGLALIGYVLYEEIKKNK